MDVNKGKEKCELYVLSIVAIVPHSFPSLSTPIQYEWRIPKGSLVDQSHPKFQIPLKPQIQTQKQTQKDLEGGIFNDSGDQMYSEIKAS